MFLLPGEVPHSPQRPAAYSWISLVIERKRQPDEEDAFQWYCENCGNKLYERVPSTEGYCHRTTSLSSRAYYSLMKSNRTCDELRHRDGDHRRSNMLKIDCSRPHPMPGDVAFTQR